LPSLVPTTSSCRTPPCSPPRRRQASPAVADHAPPSSPAGCGHIASTTTPPTKADAVPSIMPRQAPPQPPTSHSTSAHVATSSIHRRHYHDRHLQCVCSNPARPGQALPRSQATMTWQRRLHRVAASVPPQQPLDATAVSRSSTAATPASPL
jgi:hypothetical protein